MSSNEAAPAVAAADTERPLTNKEKRQLAVAQKRAAKEQALASKTDSPAKRKAPDAGAEGAEGAQAEQGAEGDEEVEVLSHKEQRRRKKLAKQADGEGEEAAGPNSLMHPTRAQGSSAAAQPRSGFSIWVGNLSFFTAPAKLVDWFEQRGVDGISRVNMPKGARRAEMNRGFCYLDLPSKDVLTAALNLSEQPLDGRKLLIKDGSDYTGRPDINTSALGIARNLPSATTSMHTAKDDDDEEREDKEERQVKGKTGLTKTAQKILRAQKNAPSMTLFLGNLSFNTTEQGVRELFDASAQRRNPRTAKNKKQKKERKPTKASSSSSSSSDSESDESDSDSDSSESSDADSDSDSESGAAVKDETKEGVKSGSSGDVVPSAAGIRKVRLGTFEDAPTKCKGFGFVDFHTLDQATASLIDPRNTFLDGRKLLLQYAGADATRRGASKTQKTRLDAPRENKKVGFMRKRPRDHDDSQPEQQHEAPAPGSFDPDAPLPKKHKETQQERAARRAGPQRRAKPGAALANAPRASVGIVQSTGTKVTFD
ncbi:hypothetical protein PaG_06258 [Moesziomyces aphidis]|uniref:RRM domain-containing protein n=1 Tax=Moesziomyces aphidis TaxID=84754 RepID=W3VG99_MOEAP|nr:hypothetical protein PaG_06258 [Moesziomyces aphidis]